MNTFKTKGFTLIELLIVVCIIAVVLAFIASRVIPIPYEYSNGERTGVITKISKKGVWWKTWEGEMNVGGMSADKKGYAIPNVWKFSVIDDSIVGKIQRQGKSGNTVTLHYSQKLSVPFWQGNTTYIITAVQ